MVGQGCDAGEIIRPGHAIAAARIQSWMVRWQPRSHSNRPVLARIRPLPSLSRSAFEPNDPIEAGLVGRRTAVYTPRPLFSAGSQHARSFRSNAANSSAGDRSPCRGLAARHDDRLADGMRAATAAGAKQSGGSHVVCRQSADRNHALFCRLHLLWHARNSAREAGLRDADRESTDTDPVVRNPADRLCEREPGAVAIGRSSHGGVQYAAAGDRADRSADRSRESVAARNAARDGRACVGSRCAGCAAQRHIYTGINSAFAGRGTNRSASPDSVAANACADTGADSRNAADTSSPAIRATDRESGAAIERAANWLLDARAAVEGAADEAPRFAGNFVDEDACIFHDGP
jgi:hypothetical protein